MKINRKFNYFLLWLNLIFEHKQPVKSFFENNPTKNQYFSETGVFYCFVTVQKGRSIINMETFLATITFSRRKKIVKEISIC